MQGPIRLARATGHALPALALLFITPCAPRVLGAAATEIDPRQDAVVAAVQRAMPCVVNVATEELVPQQTPWEGVFREFFDPYYRRHQPNTQYSLGSGVVIDEEGFVLTNFHVVNRARRVWVKFADGREFEAEKITGTSLTDVALLRIRGAKGEKFSAIRFAGDDDLLLGETVLALGNPFGLGGSVSRGILSSKSRRPPTENEPLDVLDWLQTDASINPGNSGGPLINLRAELIGISVAIYREGQGIGFAIPIKRIASTLGEIYSPEILEKLWFGARIRPGPSLQVMSVQVDSPAGKAGLRPGDIILQLDNQTPRSFIDFNRRLAATKDGHEVELIVQRAGTRRTLVVHLVPENTFFNEELIRRKLGFSVKEMTPALAREMGLQRAEGLLITSVDRQTPASAANLARGMILAGVDGQTANDIIPVARSLHAKGKGDKVKLDVIVPRQRGVFLELNQASVELLLR